MYAKYIFYSLMFLASFAVGQGALNENVYIKQFAFGAAFTAMAVVALILPNRDKPARIRITWGDILVLALLTIYIFFHADTCNALDITLFFVCFLFYGFIRMTAGDDPAETVRILSRIVPAVMLLHVLCCALQFFGIFPAFHGYFSTGGTFGNPDMSGAYLAVLSPFCYVNREWRTFKTVVLCLTAVLLLLLQARTALVSGAIAGLAYLLLSGKLSKRTFFRWVLIPATAVVAALVWWHPDSVAGRLFIWWIALNMLVSRPAGWGMYAFEKHYPEFQAEYVAGHDIPAFFHPDAVHSPYNEFLNVGVTLGVGGLLLYLSFIVLVFIAAYRARSPLLYPVCVFLVVSLSYFPFKITPLAIVGIALSALIVGHCPIGRCTIAGLKWKRWLLFAIIAPVAWLTWNSYRIYRQWQEAVTDSNREEGEVLFSKLYPEMKGNGRFLITWADVRYRAGDTLSSLSLMEEAEQLFCDPVFLQNLALLYERNGQTDEAEKAFDKAVHIVPESFGIGYERILFLQRAGKHQKAHDEAVKLYRQPVRSKYYADPFIIKAKLKNLIQSNLNEEVPNIR